MIIGPCPTSLLVGSCLSDHAHLPLNRASVIYVKIRISYYIFIPLQIAIFSYSMYPCRNWGSCERALAVSARRFRVHYLLLYTMSYFLVCSAGSVSIYTGFVFWFAANTANSGRVHYSSFTSISHKTSCCSNNW